MQIIPIDHPLRASVFVPGSKSITNRALLIATLSRGNTNLSNVLLSDDTRYFANALRALGFEISESVPEASATVVGLGGHIPAEKADLFVGNAGTAARFLAAFVSLGSGEYILSGTSRMQARPMGDLISGLKQLGVNIEAASGHLPLRVTASGLAGGRASLGGNTSSQFLSALLLVAPCARQPVELNVSTKLTSRPYVDMTIAVMHDFGVDIWRKGYETFVVQPSSYRARERYAIEPDATAASYFLAAAAICGGTVRVENLTRQSIQGDVAFLDILQKLGCQVVEGPNYTEVHGCPVLRGIDVDLRDTPDTAQTLAAIAPFASDASRIRGIASARVKETDRIQATCTELRRLGIRADEHSDGMTIHPCHDIHPARIRTYNDHRMAMAFSLIGLRIPGVFIENPECVSKTFPKYFETLDLLR